ncbi:ABC transporter ATP-binding protein [Mycetocola tolaasinivorans]|uniref:ABC transporter ATP-binding protein n=1 Tax=Mycetocola tolaasinivorans TaxID=76635 RepID=A0A3L7A7M7_9MICO|nr:ABC transporter ATP-binding protein [Mycetocola tolaasinivorans]RLP75581.1 ABC transporter ATP-binding protein [Mycetocola tolaasinivorans]
MSTPDAQGTQPLIRARDLVLNFGQTQALRGISLDVYPGEVLAVMGPSGSGKSTLLHTLAGVLVPDSGTVRIGTRVLGELDQATRDDLRLRECGFVFQSGQLLPDLGALDNVTIPLLLAGVRRREAIDRGRAELDRLGVGQYGARYPAELSGGQAQRVAIARALVTRPRVLFADEPTGALDSLSAETTMVALTDLARADGTAVVLVTHDARTAAYADREIIVRDGRISAGIGVPLVDENPADAGTTAGFSAHPGFSR